MNILWGPWNEIEHIIKFPISTNGKLVYFKSFCVTVFRKKFKLFSKGQMYLSLTSKHKLRLLLLYTPRAVSTGLALYNMNRREMLPMGPGSTAAIGLLSSPREHEMKRSLPLI